MTAATLQPGRGQSSQTTFTVAVIHEDLADGARAKKALEMLQHVLAPQFQIRSLLWSYQKLQRLDIRAMALHAAAGADMIIIAASAQNALPQHIERWMDACLADHHGRRPILVTLADDEDVTPGCQAGQFLLSVRQLASRWQADFMGGAELRHEVDPGFVRQRVVPAPGRSLEEPLLDFGSSPRLYGIND